MTQPAIRPEDRRRDPAPLRGDDAPLWAACRRSEGFAEDLPPPLRLAALPPRVGAGWRGSALSPGMGLALAAVLGVLAR